MTLRTKTSLMLSLLIATIFAAYALILVPFLQSVLKQSVIKSLESVSSSTAEVLSRFVRDKLRDTRAIGLMLPQEALEQKNVAVIEEKLKAVFEIFPELDNGVVILDITDGRLWVDYPVHAELRGNAFDYREYFKRTLQERQGVTSVPYKSARTGEPVIAFTSVLRDSSNRPIGILVCATKLLSPNALDGIRSTKIGQTGYVYVYDTSRLMILHPEDERILERDVPPGANPLFDAALEGGDVAGETVNSRGIPMIVSLKHVPGTNWIVGAQQQQSEAYDSVTTVLGWSYYGVGFLLLLVVLVGAMGIRRITMPIEKLHRAALQLAFAAEDKGKDLSTMESELAGELTGLKGFKEIEDLSGSFRQMTRVLNRNVQSFREMLVRTPAVIYTARSSGDFGTTFVSDNIESVTGYEASEFIENSSFWIEHVHPEDASHVMESYSRIIERDRSVGEYRFQHKDGSYHWMYDEARLVRDGSGNPLEIVGYFTDITSRRRMEESLAQALLEHQNIMSSVSDIICVFDSKGNLIKWNRQAELDTGLSGGELRNQAAKVFFPDREQATAIAAFLEVMEKGSVQINVNLLRSDGAQVPYQWSGTALKDSQGNVTGIIAVGRDFSERVHYEQQLRENEARFRSLSESSPVGIFETDIEGRCLYTNRKWQETTGLTLDESLGDGWTKALHPEDREMVISEWEKCVQQKSELTLEFRFWKPTGDVRWVRSHAALIRDIGGDAIGYVGTNEDVTEHKAMLEELLKTRKLEATGILAGGIAHDFNNLLSIVTGNVNLAQMDIQVESPAARSLAEALKAVRQAGDLAKKFITFSTGGAPLKRHTSVQELLTDSVALALSGSNVDCDFSFPKLGSWTGVVEVDPLQMREAVTNVILNAREAMPEGGIITIAVQELEVGHGRSQSPVSAMTEGRYIGISITDHGSGIAREHLNRIFDPYFSTKDRGSRKGMGLGLAITNSIVKKHDGYIQVESRLELGTTVTIYLRAGEEGKISSGNSEAEAPIPAQPEIGEEFGRILVMDDEEMFRTMLQMMLKRIGCEDVVVAKDGAEAVECFTEAKRSGKPFQIVILDLTVKGGMGGREALEKMQAIDPEARAIVSSGYCNDPVISQFREHGFKGVLVKPYQMDELTSAIEKTLRGK